MYARLSQWWKVVMLRTTIQFLAMKSKWYVHVYLLCLYGVEKNIVKDEQMEKDRGGDDPPAQGQVIPVSNDILLLYDNQF